MFFFLLIIQAGVFEICTPFFQGARLDFEALDCAFLRLNLLLVDFLYIEQVVESSLEIFDLQQGIECLFALAGSFHENSGKGALRHSQGIAEEDIQWPLAINAEELMKLIQHVGTLFNTKIGFAVIDDPFCARAAAPLDLVGTVIAADKMDDYAPIFFAFAHELRLVIRKIIEEGEANSFDDGGFTGAIWSADSGCAATKIYGGVAIALDIL